MRDDEAGQLGKIRGELDALRQEMRAVRSDLTQMAIEQRSAISSVKIGLVRLEQLLDAKFQTTKLIERVARLEERLARA